MRVLVCGGRDYGNRRHVYKTLDAIHFPGEKLLLVIAGGANGADALAIDWARGEDVRRQVFIADWETHGRAAGPLRNQQMIDKGKPDLVVAFPGGRGTADMVRRAEAAGIKVVKPCEHVDASEEARKSDLLPVPKVRNVK